MGMAVEVTTINQATSMDIALDENKTFVLMVSPRQIDLFSIAKATNIHGTKFDLPANPIANNGKLTSGITAATYTSFVNIVDSTQLARFGLHNGK